MLKKTGSKNKIVWSVAIGASATAALLIYMRAQQSVPSSDEFFKRNSHLTRPKNPPVEVVKERTADEFSAGDFRLMKGKAYPIALDHEMKLTHQGKSVGGFGFSGNIKIHSLGFNQHLLTLVVDYSLTQLKGGLKLSDRSRNLLGLAEDKRKSKRESQQTSVSALDRSLLVRLDPSGKIKEVYSANADLDDGSLELKLTALNLLFRRLPQIQSGRMTRPEWDDAGISYPVNYTISDLGKGLFRVTGVTLLDEKLAESQKKAASQGAPGLALLSLENERRQEFDWLWDQEKNLPRSQKFKSSTQLKSAAGVLTDFSGNALTTWGEATQSNFAEADLKKFKVSVDFKAILRGGKMSRTPASTQAKGKPSPLRRTWTNLSQSLEKLGTLPSDSARDALFVDLSRAVREDPSMIESVRATALQGNPGSREVSMLVGALGSEGSPAAQNALVEIFNRPSATPAEKEKIMTELTLLSRPLTAETKRFLTSVYESSDPMKSDVSGAAGLALGASIAHDGDPATIRFLNSEWSSAKGIFGIHNQPDKQAYLLTAMGNSKSDAFSSQVNEGIVSQRSDVRSAAVNSLRFTQDKASRDLLFTALHRDPNSEVRITAAQSLLYQPFDQKTWEGLKECTQNSNESSMKIQCYRVLSMRMEQPEVRPYLQGRAATETDPQVKLIIDQALKVKLASAE